MVFSSVTNSSISEGHTGQRSTSAKYSPGLVDEDQIPIQPEEKYSPSQTRTLGSKVYVEACTTPRPPANTNEILFFDNKPLPEKPSLKQHRPQCGSRGGRRPSIATAGQDGDATNFLSPESITFFKNIAITEEAAELATPDVAVALEIQPVISACPGQDDQALKFQVASDFSRR